MHALISKLDSLIGHEVRYDSRQFVIIDIVQSGPSLVLAAYADFYLQDNAHGHASRRAPRTHTIPLRSEVSDDLHPVLREVLGGEFCEELLRLLELWEEFDARH